MTAECSKLIGDLMQEKIAQARAGGKPGMLLGFLLLPVKAAVPQTTRLRRHPPPKKRDLYIRGILGLIL